MALKRFSSPVDGSIPIEALLFPTEDLLASQDNLGIYDGNQKSPQHQNGTIYATSLRLFYISAHQGPNYNDASFSVDLECITKTEYYAGLFTSSPKITLFLSKPLSSTRSNERIDYNYTEGTGGQVVEEWECEVCGNKNRLSIGQRLTSGLPCELCGVPRSSGYTSASASTSTSTPSTNNSAPSHSQSPRHHPQVKSLSTASTPSVREGGLQRKPSSVSCPACTFLNHPSVKECEICGSKLPSLTNYGTSASGTKSAPITRTTSPFSSEDEDKEEIMKLSFRKGGDKPFYAVLKRALKTKAWEGNKMHNPITLSVSRSSDEAGSPLPGGGISGILRTTLSSTEGRSLEIKDALQDLEALMIKAKDMVRLAAELNDKLTAATSSSASSTTSSSTYASSTTSTTIAVPEEAEFIRSSLSQLGLRMPTAAVTNDMIKDETAWISSLARELSSVLKGMMTVNSNSTTTTTTTSGTRTGTERGIIALDEVWCGWNRARGVSLLPPSTFLQVVPLLPQYTDPPIQQRRFKRSGVVVLHTPEFSQREFRERVKRSLLSTPPNLQNLGIENEGSRSGNENGSGNGNGKRTGGAKTTMDIAVEEGITVALAQEMMEEVEEIGDVVRDDAGCAISESGVSVGVGMKWWINVFQGYSWDGEQID